MTDKLSKKTSILISAPSSAAALSSLLDVLSEGHSMTAFAEALGIQSRGYIADVLSGRRRLAAKYDDLLCRHLELTALQETVLRLLLEIDRARVHAAKQPLRRTLERFRKLLKAETREIDATQLLSPFACAVWASLGCFGNAANENQIATLFAGHSLDIVKAALHELIHKGFVELAEGVFRPTGKILMLTSHKPHANLQVQFLQQSIAYAERIAPLWFDNQEASCFQSFTLSVVREQYLEAVKRLKMLVYQELAALESNAADSVVQVNVQMFPHALPVHQKF